MVFFSFLDNRSIAEDITRLRPGLYGYLGPMAGDIMTASSAFSVGEREFMGAYVSALNDCSFCHGVHRATAVAHGVNVSSLEALLEDIDTTPVDARMNPFINSSEGSGIFHSD